MRFRQIWPWIALVALALVVVLAFAGIFSGFVVVVALIPLVLLVLLGFAPLILTGGLFRREQERER